MRERKGPGDGEAIAAMNTTTGLSRREVLALGGALLLQAVLSGCGSSAPVAAGAGTPGTMPPPVGFLEESELATLRAFVDRMIPADSDPGALAAKCAEAIDRLLGAFGATPPFIYAGAPFSDRGGHPQNHFRDFVALDPYEALGWRLAIEGSQSRPELEFNGPVKGLQAIYREGLARLDALAVEQGFAGFAAAPAPAQDLILNGSDPLVAELIDVGFPDTLDAMYGAPEYGGNQDLAGWGFTGYDGDVQPRGYSDDEIVNADNPGPLDLLLPPSYHDPARRGGAALKSSASPRRSGAPLADANAATLAGAPPFESMFGLVQAAEGRVSRLRALLATSRARVAAGGAHG